MLCAAHTTSKASLWKRNVLFDCHVTVLLKLFENWQTNHLPAIFKRNPRQKRKIPSICQKSSAHTFAIYTHETLYITTLLLAHSMQKVSPNALDTPHHLQNNVFLAESHNNEYALLISIFYSRIKDRNVKLTWVGRFFYCRCRCCCSLVIHLSCLYRPSKSMCLYMPRACLTHTQTLSPLQSQKASVAKTLLKWNKETRKRP